MKVVHFDKEGCEKLHVRGEDQLFSYYRPLSARASAVVSGAGGWVISLSPADGYVWVVTNVSAADMTSPTTEHNYSQVAAMGTAHFYRQTEAFAAGMNSCRGRRVYLEHDDIVRVYFIGSLAGDTCRVELTGYEMTLET